ncbi:MAG: hypothetical protein HZA50_10035 [Planctomycetes bacterium]|nr:hypothetical protein [Planctomycetota bacterium]
MKFHFTDIELVAVNKHIDGGVFAVKVAGQWINPLGLSLERKEEFGTAFECKTDYRARQDGDLRKMRMLME